MVCRACSRNRYPLKYLKDRVAKVCDHCYAELRKRGESQLSVCSVRLVEEHSGKKNILVCFFLFDMVLTVYVCVCV